MEEKYHEVSRREEPGWGLGDFSEHGMSVLIDT